MKIEKKSSGPRSIIRTMDIPPDIDRLLNRRPYPEAEIVETMVATYRARCYRLACSILGDPEDAEDAVQQAFLSAAIHLEQYQPGTDLKAWIFTITINGCRGILRKRKARRFLDNLLRIARSPIARSNAPEDSLVLKESASRLWSAVNNLEDKYRLVVILRFGQNLAVSEIASILSIREKTVYTRLYHAFSLLRSKLAGDADLERQENSSWEEVIP